MKTLFNIIAIVFLTSFSASAQNEMVVEGTYQGENLYVQNPFSSSGVGFCVIEVMINDQLSIDEINSSAFEIDFTSYELSSGQDATVNITYKDGCTPRCLNPHE